MRRNITFFSGDLTSGGAEKVVVVLANELAKRGHSVTILLVSRRGSFLSQVRNDVLVESLGGKRARLCLLPLWKYVKNNKIDTLISASYVPNLLSSVAVRLLRKRPSLILTFHNSIESREGQSKILFDMKLRFSIPLLSIADYFVGVSELVCQRLIDYKVPPSKVAKIYNPIVSPERSFLAQEKTNDPWVEDAEIPLVVSIGRLHRVKGHDLTIRAVARIPSTIPVKLAIIGEGPEYQNLKALIESLGVSKRVKLIGYTKNVYKYLKYANVCVLASRTEGFGNVVAEALSMGVPIVATRSGGPEEILGNGEFGVLVDVGNVEQLATAIVEALLTETPDRALAQRSYLFSVDQSVDKYCTLIKRCMYE